MPSLPEKPLADGAAMDLPLNDLGWVGNDPQAAAVNELREYLQGNNGIKGLEVVSPEEVDKATQLFYRDGFVAVRDVLSLSQLDYIRDGCDRIIHEIVSRDKNRTGNRGSHRYSFGGASLTGHLAHEPEWAMLIDLPSITPILTSIFGSGDYIARGGGGDFCLPGAVDYQRLHSDMNNRRLVKRADGSEHTVGSFHDPRGQLTYRDLPCPYVCCNFLTVDSTPTNGPTRQIPGTQHSHDRIPDLSEEPDWMKLSTVCPAPAGSVLMRDVRAWHGGTPNLSNEVRSLPNAEFFAPWYRERFPISMPRSIYDELSEHGKWISRYIVADRDEELVTGYREDLGNFLVNFRAPKT